MNLLLTGCFQYSDDQISELKTLVENVFIVQDERIPLDQQVVDFDPGEIDAVICNALFKHNELSKFARLSFVQLTSAGFDRIPYDAMKLQGVRVENAKGVYSAPMAEWAVSKALEIYKHSRSFYRAQERRQWLKNRNVLELTGKVVSIFGLGSVGILAAKRFQAFDCHVIGIDPYVTCVEFVDEHCSLEEVEAALGSSDIIVLALPLNEETRHYINRSKIGAMKEDAVLINLSRGEVIDEAALIEALEKGKFLGVAMDVFEKEPLPENSPLWVMQNVIVTPHNAFVSDLVGMRMFELMKENLSDFIGRSS